VLNVEIYHAGTVPRVRLHHHPYARDERCGPECHEYAAERCYGKRGDSPAEYRKRVVAAVVAVLLDPSIGHREFSFLVSDQKTLF